MSKSHFNFVKKTDEYKKSYRPKIEIRGPRNTYELENCDFFYDTD